MNRADLQEVLGERNVKVELEGLPIEKLEELASSLGATVFRARHLQKERLVAESR